MYESNEKKLHWKIRSFIAKLFVKVRHRFGHLGHGSASVRPNQQNGGSVVHYHAGFWEEAAMPNFAEQIFSFLLQTEKLA